MLLFWYVLVNCVSIVSYSIRFEHVSNVLGLGFGSSHGTCYGFNKLPMSNPNCPGMVEMQCAFIGDEDKNVPSEQTTTQFDCEAGLKTWSCFGIQSIMHNFG